MLSRRDALKGGTATVAAIAGAGAVAATVPAINGPDARMEELYREWRTAEDAFEVVCKFEDDADRAVKFQGVEVEGPDGKVHACKIESEIKRLFPLPFALTAFSDDDLAAFTVAARRPSTEEKERIMAEIWSRYPDVHAEAREAALERLEEAKRAHQKSPEVQEQRRAKEAWTAAEDRVEAILGTIAETPAATLRGVLTKFRIWTENDGDGFPPADAVRDSAVADLRRLAGEMSS